MKIWIFFCGLFILFIGKVHGDLIAVYNDPTYIDNGSASGLQSQLAVQSHTVSTFSGLDTQNFVSTLAATNVVVFPSLLSFGKLLNDLPQATADVVIELCLFGWRINCFWR